MMLFKRTDLEDSDDWNNFEKIESFYDESEEQFDTVKTNLPLTAVSPLSN